MSVYKLDNPMINSHWGCPNSMTELFGYKNESNLPMAELWMGAHPSAPSQIDVRGERVGLDEFIALDSVKAIGQEVSDCFSGRLPYLFKVLAAQTPLSIQSHPSKEQAEIGYQTENDLKIPLDAGYRNYKDDNHKPELVYALTEYHALNGFRPIEQIVELWKPVSNQGFVSLLDGLAIEHTQYGLRQFYKMVIMTEDKAKLVSDVVSRCETILKEKYIEPAHKEAYNLVLLLNEYYPNDIGVLSALMLNYVVLEPGEAMFLKAGTLHAYLNGVALELMANSNNVLRGGLTPKHVDIDELIKTTEFSTLKTNEIKCLPIIENEYEKLFNLNIRDFKLSVMSINNELGVVEYESSGADIIFVIEGDLNVTTCGVAMQLTRGESAFIPANVCRYQISGSAEIAIASDGLSI